MDYVDIRRNSIHCGDSLTILQKLEDSSVNLVITSPPYYNQRDYGGIPGEVGGETSLDQYMNRLYDVFHECIRVLRPDGNLVVNLGDKYVGGSLQLVPYRFALGLLEREPLKLVNEVTWVKLNPTPRQFRRRLVSSTEPFFHFVKDDGYYYDLDSFQSHKDRNRKRSGKNVGKRYYELIKSSDLSDDQKQLARKELEEVIEEVKRGELAGFRMKIRGIHAEPFGGQEGGRKSQLDTKGFTIIRMHGRSLKRDVIEGPVETIRWLSHPAVYPEYVVQEFVKLLTRRGDLVLDPFLGSGTTAVVCKRMGRDFIGIDINPEYCRLAEERVNNAIPGEEEWVI